MRISYLIKKPATFKMLFLCLTLILSVVITNQSYAQLSGTKTIPSVNYPTIKVAVDSLNLYGVAGGGGVTFNVAAGYTETLTARLNLTATGSASEQIIFQKSGAGANPAITAYSGVALASAADPDGMWSLTGSDYVTIDGINLNEAAGNTTTALQMEYGYGLFKASGSDGANNNTIKNCVITLNRNNTVVAGAGFITGGTGGSMGIVVAACTPTTGTTVTTVTSVNGASSNNKFYSNTIQNVHVGIALTGYAGASPFTLCDFNNDIGGTSALTGNTIINFGGGTTPASACAAVYFSNQWSLNCSYNTVNNNNGSGINHATSQRGIWAFASSIGASATINNNNVTIQGGTSTSAIDWAINCEMAQSGASGNTININNNTISAAKTAASTVAFTAIWVNSAATTVNITGNTISNFTYAGTGVSECILSQLAGIGTLNISNNNFSGINTTGATGSHYNIGVTTSVVTALNINGNTMSGNTITNATSKVTRGIYVSTAVATEAISISNNNFQNFTWSGGTPTGEFAFVYGIGTALSYTINNNALIGSVTIPTSGSTYLIYNSTGSPTINVLSNTMTGTGVNRTGATGLLYGYYNFGVPTGTATIAGNTWSNMTVTGTTTLYGAFFATNTTCVELFQNNTITNLTAGTGVIEGVHFGYGQTGSEISGNNINNLTGAGLVTGIKILTTASNSLNVFNNNVNTLTTTGASVVAGIDHTAGLLTSIYKNKIYNLNANNAGASAIGISVSVGTSITLYNNLIGDLKTNAALTGANQIIGISLTGGTTVNAYYNTVYLNATTVGGANFGSSAISVNATPSSITLRNNIFVNNSTPTGTGLAVAYRRASTALTNYSSSSNNNLFYAGTPSASNLIFYDGTNSDQTVMAYKARVFPADANSGTENPTFLSTVGSNANFLHIDAATATNLESGAVNISGITNDYDLETRQGNGGYVGTGTAPDIGADEVGGTPAAALAAPINFTYNTATTSSFNITWDDNSVGEAGFVVYRSLNVGGPFNTIVAAIVSTSSLTTGTTYTLPQTALLGNTTYYYQIVANNFSSSAPLAGNASTLPCGGGLAGTFSIPTNYGSLTAAITALNTNGMTGPVILELEPSYTSALEPGFPVTISNAIGCLSPANPLTIRPQSGVSSPLLITSANTTATIDISGANFVTIDGRPGGTGTNKYLIIENTSTTAASAGNAVLIRNEASNNTLTYLDVRSANSNVASNSATFTIPGGVPGAIAIGTTAGAFGNDNNMISYCDVHSLSSGGSLGVCIFHYNATTAGALSNNDNNTIDNCNIYDFFLAGSASAGINISAGNNIGTVTNNSIYQTGAPKNYAAGTQVVRAMWITPNTSSLTSASGFTINNNYIGGSAPLCGGAAMNLTGTANYTYFGMDISVGIGAATSVQNNTLTNWNFTGGWTTNSVYGINISNGNANVGTVTGNLIGSTTANGAITLTTTVTNGSFIGLRSGAGGTINFSNNTVSGIDMIGNSTTIATGFNGIAGSGGAVLIVNNNTIGSPTLANSINMVSTSATSTTATAVRGIICNSGTAGVTNTITNNLVANINTNYSATGTQTNTLIGISATTGITTISGNTIRNLSSASQTTAGGGTPVVLGINYSSTAATPAALISNNTIHTLKATNPAATSAIQTAGIYFSGPSTGNPVIERNFIHSISIASPTNSAGFITGIDLGTASGATIAVRNNMIRLGLDETGASVTAPCTVRGITKNVPNSNIWFNSIYIGGTGVGTTPTNTFCLVRSASATDDWRNNILVNERSNSATGGKHYSINLNATTTLTLNYNDYYGTGTGYVFGYNGTADVASYATNWISGDANSYNLDPLFVNPTGTSATVDLHIDPINPTIVESTGIAIGSVTNDFDNQTRSTLTPTDMGADAGNFVNFLCNGTPPNSTASFVGNSSAICISGTKTMTLSGFSAAPGMTYQWQQSLTPGGPYTDVTTGTGGTTIIYTTPTLTQTTYYVCVVTCSNGGLFTPSSELAVIVNNPQILSAPSVSRCGSGSVTLCATSSPGTTINWYSSPTGGSPLTTPYSNIPVTGFNNDIVADGVGTNSILGITYSFGPDGAGYAFMDNSYKYVSTNAFPTCFMPVNKLAASLQTPGLTYQFQDYYNGAPTVLNNNAMSIANQSTTYTSPLSSSGTLTLVTPASYATLKVLYESVVNAAPLTVDATVTFTDATTQTFNGNTCVNWFTATSATFKGVGRTSPTGGIECGSSPNFFPNMFELSLPISVANQSKLVQSITFSIPTVLSSGTTPASVNYFHAMAVGGNAPATPGCFTTPVISATTPYYVEASTTGGSNQISSNGVPTVSTSTQNGGVIFNLNVDVTINSIQVYSSAAGTATVTLMNSALTTLYTSAAIPIVNGGLSTPQTLNLGWAVPAGSGYRILVANTGNSLGYHTGAFPAPMGNGVGSIVNGALNTGTSTLNYFVYNINTTAGCVSGRTLVNAIVTSPPAFTITPSLVVCNNAIAMLNVTSPSANYDSVTWAPITNLFTDAAATIPYSGGNEDTVYFRSATHSANTITCTANNTLPPYCGNVTTTTVNVQPATATVTLSKASLCFSGSVTLGLSPASPYAPGSIQWQVSADNSTFNNIAGAITDTYTTPVIDTTTYYRAIIKNSNGDTCFYSDAVVTVNEPAILTTTGASSCTPASLTLNATATSGATINWFANATGGISLGSGPSYTTPTINNSTTYYAAASNGGGGGSTTGMPAVLSTATSGSGTTNYGLVFDALSSFTLNSVTVYPVSATSASGTVTIDVINSAGTVLNSITTNVVGSPAGTPVATVINCNFNIAAGTNLKMRPGFTGITGLLFEPSASAPGGNYGYPYVVPGILSINTSTLTAAPTNTPRNDLYYYFYNWNIATDCEGPRVPVVAAISTVPTSITTVTSPVITCTPGQSVTLNVTGSNGVLAAGGSWEYQWMDETGTTVLQAWSASSTFSTTAVSGLNKYRIYMRNSACPATEGFDYATFIVGITGSAIGVSPTGCSPTGTIIVAATGSGVLTDWYNNDFTSATLGSAAAVTGSATVTGGQCVITTNTVSQSGALQVFNPGAISAANYQIDFDLGVLPSGADGISYSFGDDVSPTATPPQFECGTGTKFKLAFDAYPNTGGNIPGMYLMYNCTVDLQPPSAPGVLSYINNTSWLNANSHVTIIIDAAGFVTVKLNGIPVMNNVQLPASYLTANRSTWTHLFKARTGGISEAHTVDNLVIKYNAFEYSINGAGGPWQASNTFANLPVGAYSVWVRNPADITCTADLGIFNLMYPTSVATNATDTVLCISGTSTLSMSPLLAGATYQWDSSGVSASGPWFTITGATSATYNAVISGTTWYRCNIYCGGTPIPGSPSVVRQVLVNNPQVVNTIPGSRCGVGTVNLSATPSVGADLNWFTNATGGSPIGTGNTFLTPDINSTTTYYVEASTSGGKASGGRITNPSGGSVLSASPRGIIFTTTKAVDIDSVAFMCSGVASTVTIQLYNSGGTATIGSPIAINIPANAGTSSSPVLLTFAAPMSIPAAGTYRLFVTSVSPTGNVLWYEFSSVTGYPYAVGTDLSITSSVTSLTGAASLTTYYYFYKLVVKSSCYGASRTPVLATVTPPPAIVTSGNASICEGNSTTLTVSSPTNDPNYIYTWNPGGLTGPSVSVTPSATTKYTITAEDISGGVNNGCVAVDSVTITVNKAPVIASAQPSSGTICGSGSPVTLTALTNTSTPGFADVGTQTTTISGSTGNPYRTSSGVGQQIRTQLLYTASELNAAGLAAGNITSLGFTTTGATGTMINLTISIGNTALSALTTTYETTPMINVFNQSTFTPIVGLNTHTFSTPFLWNGTSNIIVEICQENSVSGTTTVACYTPGFASNTAITNVTGCSALTGSSATAKPIISIGGQVGGGLGAGTLGWQWTPGGLPAGNVVTANPVLSTTYTVTATNLSTGCTATATVGVNVTPNPKPVLLEGDTILCSNDLGFDMHVVDTGAYKFTGYPAGTTINFYGSGGILYQTGTGNVFFNQNQSDAFYVEVILPSYLGSCTALSDTSVVDFNGAQAPQYLITTDSVKCYGGSTGKAKVEIVFGGTGDFRYQWYSADVNTYQRTLLRDTTAASLSDSLQNLPEGRYVVVITDHQGIPVQPYCSIQDSADLGQPEAPLSVTENTGNHVNVLCNGALTGVIDLDLAGGTVPYSYNWSNGTTNQDLTNAGVGTYTCTVTDERGCSVTISSTITEPTAIVVNGTVNQILCFGGSGSVNLTVNGGVPPYTYNWSNGATNSTNSNLLAGTYTVTVTDGNSCTMSSIFIMNPAPSALSLTCSSTNVTCRGAANGFGSVAGTGGISPYTYLWSNGNTTSAISGLVPGGYTVTVTDLNGCTAVCGFTITQPNTLKISLSATNPSSVLPSSGTITSTTVGGTSPYTYLWNDGVTTSNRAGLPGGVYTVTVTDALGCTASNAVTLTYACSLSATNQLVQQASCFLNNGIMTVIPSGGTSYSYQWQTNPVQTTATGTGLAYGFNSYCLITDLTSGCTFMDTVIVPTRKGLKATMVSPTYAGGVNIRCNGESNGSINLTVTGTTGLVTYLWSNGATTEDLTNLSAGVYTVTITNAGCILTSFTTLTQPAVLSATASSIAASCGVSNGSATATATGGKGTYTYSWNTIPVKTTRTATGLSAGVYTVTVGDANGCTATAMVTVTSAAGLTVNGTPVNVSCNGGNNGSISLSVSGGAVPYTYIWSNGSTSKNQNAVPAGTYTVTVTSSNGCTGPYSATITQPTAITATASSTPVSCFGGINGTATVVVNGGSPGYTYSWNSIPVKTTATATGLKKGTYACTITDTKGCIRIVTTTVTEPSTILVSVSKTNVSIFGGNNGTATANVSGGVSPYSYAWSTAPVQTTQTATGLVAGTYTVVVTDFNGCTKSGSVTITQPTARLAGGEQETVNSIVYPNPSNGMVTVSFDQNIAAKVSVSVHTLTGNQVFSKELEVKDNATLFDLDLTGLAKGIYSIQYRTNDKHWIEKLVIQ